jgi:hypothetical protein
VALPDDQFDAELSKSKFPNLARLLTRASSEIAEGRYHTKLKDNQGEEKV